MTVRTVKSAFAAPVLINAILVGILWWPALFEGRTILQGDSIVHGLPLMIEHADWFAGRGSIVWAPWIYGGHPIFAEGQGAFAEPLNILFAACVTPLIGAIAAMNWFHAATMVMTGIGCAGLSTELGLGAASATLVTVALDLSPYWTGTQQNLTISGAIAWIPWTVWAAEAWLRQPDRLRSTLFGAAVCMMVLAGYPQALHATLLYIAASFVAGAPAGWWRNARAYGVGLAIAVAVAVGASAIQWLPLAELVGQSHRAGGVGLVFHSDLTTDLRGMLFSQDGLGGLGSLLVLVLVPFGAGAGVRARGHLIAALTLGAVALGDTSPPFSWTYSWRLIPGEHFFRITGLYLAPSLLGLTVVAGLGAERASRWTPTFQWRVLVCLSAAFAWTAIAVAFGPSRDGMLQVGLALGALGLIAGWGTERRGLRFALATMVVFECLALRLHPLSFFDRSLLRPPDAVISARSRPAWRERRTYDTTLYGAVGLLSPHDPRFLDFFHASLGAFVGLSDRMWGMPSMNGALALALARREALEPVLHDEALGRGIRTRGLRLIDLLDVSLLATNAPAGASGFRPLPGLTPDDPPVWVNPDAKARVQLYSRHVMVADVATALKALERTTEPVLAIENPRRLMLPGDEPEGDATFTVEKSSDTFHRIDVHADHPVWLFLADADYPGWGATIDGRAAPLFAAQVLGKAVAVPAGVHEVVIRFRSRSIELGSAITLTTLALLAAACAMRFGSRRTPDRHTQPPHGSLPDRDMERVCQDRA